MRKYLLADTNTYIYCSLLTEEKEDEKLLEVLIKLLDDKKLYILLPEIIKLEYQRKLRIQLDNIKKALQGIKDVVSEKLTSNQIKKEIKSSIDEAINKRQKKINETEKMVDEIFAHENTIKIELTPEIYIKSYSRAVSGLKPYKHIPESFPTVQPDCLIIESTKIYLSQQKKHKFFIVSNNKKDFALIEDKKKPKIHPEIENEFDNVEYFLFLYQFLNKKFRTKLKKKELTVAKKAEEGRLDLPVIPGSLADIALNARAVQPSGIMGVTADSMFRDSRGISLATSVFPSPASIYPNLCKRCGKTFFGDSENGFCPSCELSSYPSFALTDTYIPHSSFCEGCMKLAILLDGEHLCEECKNQLRKDE